MSQHWTHKQQQVTGRAEEKKKVLLRQACQRPREALASWKCKIFDSSKLFFLHPGNVYTVKKFAILDIAMGRMYFPHLAYSHIWVTLGDSGAN